MDSSIFIPPRCVLSRCRLCRFDITEDESAVVVSETGTKICEFTYTSSFDIKDKNLKWRLISCTRICDHVNGIAIVCHLECRAFALKCWSHAPEPPFLSFFRATEYAFDPSEIEKRKRLVRTRMIFAAKLSNEYSFGFPMDVWMIITEYLIRYCAIVTAKEACSNFLDSNTYFF
ncbi:hypothetical protein F5X99DRAFT_102312 [Biscogniauxia marginata]|nr:hypothetical protein F5X99DRAFT_102312 [Biscogniauxia marginata]